MGESVVTIPFRGRRFPRDPRLEGSGPAAIGSFFAGRENLLVEPAIEEVLCRRPAVYNPLVLYGASGTGKSHLARGIAAAWQTHYPGGRVVSTVAVDFARELAEAGEAQSVEDFRAHWRGADLAVFEDVADLAGRDAAQVELIRTLDVLLEDGAQVVVTARAAPAGLDGLSPALRSRLMAGLSVPLSPPGPDSRRAVLRQWSKLRRLDLADAIVDLLVNGLEGTVPELVGAMVQLEVPARLAGGPIDAAAVRRFLAKRQKSGRPHVRDIAAAAARHFSLKLGDLRGASRRRPVVAARDVAMLLARQLTKESLLAIGQYFGRRDHTTVLHGCRKAEQLLRSDPAIRQAVDQLYRKLQSKPAGNRTAKRTSRKEPAIASSAQRHGKMDPAGRGSGKPVQSK
jgi:chromosomal replication initiator protein